jgi:hypothetical protein
MYHLKYAFLIFMTCFYLGAAAAPLLAFVGNEGDAGVSIYIEDRQIKTYPNQIRPPPPRDEQYHPINPYFVPRNEPWRGR